MRWDVNQTMKRTSLSAIAVGALALGSVGVAQAADDDKTIGSTLNVAYKEADSSDPYGTSQFKGTVGPKKCAKGRQVSIKGYGTEKTNKKGKFAFDLDGPAFPGKYTIKLAEKEIKEGVVCSSVKATLKVTKN
jgi:hypothetical protein